MNASAARPRSGPPPGPPSGPPPGAPPGPLQRLRRSLRARLLAVFVLLALGTTLVFVAGSSQVFSAGWRELVRPLVADYVARLADEIGSPPDVQKAQAITERLPLSIAISGPRVQWRSPARSDHDHLNDVESDGHAHPRDTRRAASDAHDPSLRALLVRRTADGHELRFGLRSIAWNEDRPRWVGWITLAALLGLTGLAYAHVRRLFRPLDDIRAGAQRYEAGDFSQPIVRRRADELGDLGSQVNAMATGLQRMLEGQRGLLLAISHELRSPLTRARLNAELLPEGAERDALLRDLAQMRDLIANLLESERLAAGRATLQLQPTDLVALVRELLAREFDGAALHLECDLAALGLPLDAPRIELLVRNLVNNALRHGAAKSAQAGSESALSLIVRLWRDAAEVHLSVRDHGPGVDPAHLARLAEPFYRPDAARSRSHGGVGLGLYLCRQVAQSHGGRLEIRAAQPGLEVILHLPLGIATGNDQTNVP